MELPHIGANCHWSGCKTLDFLPITCAYCNEVFCQNHFQVLSHNCPDVVNKQIEEINETARKNPTCSMGGCSKTDPVEMLCVKCNLHHCLNHRYHDCFDYSEEEIEKARQKFRLPREQFSKNLEKVSAKLDENIEKSKKSEKNRAMALKVQLMRLKGKAKGEGNIPATDRIYFLIFPPLNLKATSKAIYVSRNWTLGRCVDSAASLCDVPNKNNVPDASKLRLFRKSNGNLPNSDMSVSLSDLLLNELILNGESLILEYVSSTESLETFSISNVSSYME